MKIHILGASGSGVTTLGQALAEKLKMPYFDSDAYFWEETMPPFTVKRDKDARNFKIKSDISRCEDWILGGSIFNWGDNVFPNFDLVVFLWIPSDIRIERLKKRELERYGGLILTDPDRKIQFDNFIAWASDYDVHAGIANRNGQAHENWLTKINFPILKIVGDLTIAERIELIWVYLQEEKQNKLL